MRLPGPLSSELPSALITEADDAAVANGLTGQPFPHRLAVVTNATF